MKKVWKQKTCVAALAACIWSFHAGATAITNDWRFDTSANPASPEVSIGPGAPQATITPGPFSSGWLASDNVLGPNTGIWDLGRNGTVTLNNPAGLAGDSSQARTLTLKVFQWYDGGIFNSLTTVTVPGATAVSSNTYTASSVEFGSWLVQETHWLAAAGSPVNSLSMTGAYNGSLVDEVVLEASVAPPAQLTIQPAGNGQAQLSWPAIYSSMILQSNPSVADPQGWIEVQAPRQMNGDMLTVTVNAADSAQFFRLKQ